MSVKTTLFIILNSVLIMVPSLHADGLAKQEISGISKLLISKTYKNDNENRRIKKEGIRFWDTFF